MTALILVVDDIPANVKLLEAKLNGEYYDVITAKDGLEAIEKVKQFRPDLILLDVMMPGMDGFETCRHLKADKDVSHIPVVMVTALSEPSDRVQGLESGADDFITKPINDTALFARVRSLVRMKVLMDELRLRDKTGLDMGVMSGDGNNFMADVSGSHIVVIDDDVVQCKKISERFSSLQHVTLVHSPAELDVLLKQGGRSVDLYMINTHLVEADGLRLATHIKSIESERHVPIIMLVDEEDTHLMLKGLELGINDYLIIPIDYNEMQARVKTQIRRKRYQDALKSNYQASISMAITDKLTGLYNRHYLDTHLNNMVRHALLNQKPLSLMIMDMDHFKSVNDTFGHDVGDEVLRQLSQIIIDSVRSSDLAARFGGEEFVVLMPESEFQAAYGMAERLRRKVEDYIFNISHTQGVLSKTLSIGVSTLNLSGDSAGDLIKRADSSLYEAKHGGRNQVMPRLIDTTVPLGIRSVAVMDVSAQPKQEEFKPINWGASPEESLTIAPAPIQQQHVQPAHAGGNPYAPQPMHSAAPQHQMQQPPIAQPVPQPPVQQPIQIQPVPLQQPQVMPSAQPVYQATVQSQPPVMAQQAYGQALPSQAVQPSAPASGGATYSFGAPPLPTTTMGAVMTPNAVSSAAAPQVMPLPVAPQHKMQPVVPAVPMPHPQHVSTPIPPQQQTSVPPSQPVPPAGHFMPNNIASPFAPAPVAAPMVAPTPSTPPAAPAKIEPKLEEGF